MWSLLIWLGWCVYGNLASVICNRHHSVPLSQFISFTRSRHAYRDDNKNCFFIHKRTEIQCSRLGDKQTDCVFYTSSMPFDYCAGNIKWLSCIQTTNVSLKQPQTVVIIAFRHHITGPYACTVFLRRTGINHCEMEKWEM